ncbi:helix-turn-helix domain-containing protein [Marinomonas transparens]|uniref:Helix-turn-helix domain-containing protein n=1 Tax=Marinomonas transparens TaxID=2795388 RepID=A0A934JJE4_9GAMM|nr:helix-turn-helix domain-containing protein [Marinomonas transparens]MBJ7537195.1 helix-turn-helix domain-containing protein [Marinomonas transparens]
MIEQEQSSIGISTGKPLLSRSEAAQYLGIRPQTLSVWACHGRYGLRYAKVGRRVMYRIIDLEEFVERRTVSNTGELVND